MNEQLVARLDKAGLDTEVELLVLAAVLGAGELEAALDGTAPARPVVEEAEAPDPRRIYLSEIVVEGFRGVGPKAKLGFVPGCGLTLVVGRNGSGKSSFAEAAELALTGSNQRWDAKSATWKDGWRNLHQADQARIAVRLVEEGQEGHTQVKATWPTGGDLGTRQVSASRPGGKDEPLETLHLGPALDTWRPFLSYDDLGSLLNAKPSELHDRLSNLLGLEDWTEVEGRLKDAAKSINATVKQSDADAKSIRADLEALGNDDDRALRALAALPPNPAKSACDLDALEALATGTATTDPDLARLDELVALTGPDLFTVDAVANRIRVAVAAALALDGTDASEARELADLLERALVVHSHDSGGGGTCPVCGTTNVLDDSWRTDATAKAIELRRASVAVTDAARELEDSVRLGRGLVRPLPGAVAEPPSGVDTTQLASAWRAWCGADDPSRLASLGPADLADHLESTAVALADGLVPVAAAALAERDRRQDRWRPMAEAIAAWLPSARRSEAQRPMGAHLTAGARWVATTSAEVRTERFAPIANQVKEVWQQLRHDSNVSIDSLSLEGAATRRRLDLAVRVDDTSTESGMAVLSQGELHALSLALFLPRATQHDSPFRFVVVDDPVQALDSARIDGLARVLATVAKDRQVVVFTHDERLPDACRRLSIDARVLEVDRGQQSAVSIRSIASPSQRYLEDARAVSLTDPYPLEARRRVVPGLCRQAVEATCLDLGRQKLLAQGVEFAEVERKAADLTKLMTHLAFGLSGDGAQGNEVYARLNSMAKGPWAVDLVKQLNKGSHELIDTQPALVVDEAERLVALLREKG